MTIHIKTVPHNKQRYDTVGDWQWGGDSLHIKVSDMDNWKYEFLVAYHELCEAVLCKDRKISETAITNFDKLFETNRKKGNEDEPGDDIKAPYRKEHFMATNIERIMSGELNVDWTDYDNKVNSL